MEVLLFGLIVIVTVVLMATGTYMSFQRAKRAREDRERFEADIKAFMNRTGTGRLGGRKFTSQDHAAKVRTVSRSSAVESLSASRSHDNSPDPVNHVLMAAVIMDQFDRSEGVDCTPPDNSSFNSDSYDSNSNDSGSSDSGGGDSGCSGGGD